MAAVRERGLSCLLLVTLVSLLSLSVAQDPSACSFNFCFNGGTCYVVNETERCSCPPSFTGQLCETNLSVCSSDTCANGGTCYTQDGEVRCTCVPGFTGQYCQSELNGCGSNPCFNGATCMNFFGGFRCTCAPGYTSRQCQTDIDDCESNPCLNGACIDEVNGYTCECLPGFTGSNCDVNINDCSEVDCLNGGSCIDLVSDYRCNCSEEFAGRNCELESNCTSGDNATLCLNNGVCVDNSSSCSCLAGFTGPSCETELNECDSDPCYNGTCVDKIGSYACNCFPGYTGQQCDEVLDMCLSQPCLHGAMCVPSLNAFDCFCRQGYTGQLCQIDIDECLGSPCQNGGNCTDMVNDFSCDCLPWYSGAQCEIDSCSSQPCENGATCIANGFEYSCVCPMDYTDENCTTLITPCYFEPCSNGATCINEDSDNYTCICPPGYTDTDCNVNIDDCQSDFCTNGGTCIDLVNAYSCDCRAGFTGSNCEFGIDECQSTPCLNNGTCIDLINGVRCMCPSGFNGTLCETNINECSSSPCSSLSTCIDEIDGFTCLCPMGFTGPLCNINILDCSDLPCGNNSTCTDTGTGYQCLCPPGYTGVHCMVNIDDCLSQPCHNNGMCVDGIDSRTCICSEDYTGDDCETPIDYCDSSPCSSLATCISVIGGYNCICPLDFTGSNCSVQINDCESNPCSNGGTCSDLVGTFACECPPGYNGSSCDENINECASLPCLNGGTCTDLVNGYSCVCPGGFNGTDCENNNTLTCTNVTCVNGGICDDTPTGFECLCPNGYTGMYCHIDIDDCSSNPCLNNATCIDQVANYTCECLEGFDGRNCAIDIDLCTPQPCLNGGVCSHDLESYNCTCPQGYYGMHCELSANPCSSNPCLNDGMCTKINGTDFKCTCGQAYGGDRCEIMLFPDCSRVPCLNNGTCTELIGSGIIGGSESRFYCQCPVGVSGEYCETVTDMCFSSPCQNNATCRGDFANYTCTCLPGFTGTDCETTIVGCNMELYPCFNGGECMEVDGQFTCMCAPGFTGPQCGYGINECKNQPCQNGGTCRDFLGYYICLCPPHYNGTNCDVLIDPCYNVDCNNNGMCQGVMDNYTCDCFSGWTGEHCETDINECEGVDCLNGMCVDLVNNFTCDCSLGFTGRHCEVNIDDCADANCNNGLCIDGIGSYQCDCLMGYTGSLCDSMIDDCSGMPCMNNGSCVDLLNNFTCSCLAGFTGRFCEANIDDCLGVDCKNGSCEDLLNDYVCNCSPGFTDRHCETNIDDCASNPCSNGGTCSDGINDFNCTCTPLYTGKICDTRIDLCEMQRPCLNNGTCQSFDIEGVIPSYECICSSPFSGDNCELQDSCLLSPCQNNATCVANLTTGEYTCHCIENYYGNNCHRFDYCHSSPCQNEGTCINGSPGNLISDTFLCICTPEYTGTDCSISLSPCFFNPCMNGGTCSEDGESYNCDCPVGYTGMNCSEVFSSDTPYFNGDSYTLVPYSPSNSNTSLVSLHFRTSSQFGLLLYVSEEDHSSYLSLGIENGLLALRLRQEGALIQSIARYHPVSDDRWHSLDVTQNGLELQINVDGYPNSTMLIDMFLTFQPAVTYLGGFDNFTALPPTVQQSSGFIGYINATVQLGGESVHIVDESIAGRNIGHGVSTGPCSPVTCSNDGICVEESAFTFSCLCPIGFRGDTCEQDVGITVPYFNTNSYHILSNNAFSLYGGLEIDLTFHTMSSNGLIFHLYDATNATNDYFLLYLQEGGLGIEYNAEGSLQSALYQGNVSNGEWHLLTVLFNTSGLYLIVDESLVLYSSNTTLNSIYLTSPLFLGGVPDGLVTDSVSRSGFNGCIRDVQVNNMSLDLIQDRIYGLGLLECSQSICPRVQCLNGGSCEDSNVTMSGFVCSCPHGYSGTYCEVSLPLCTPNPCMFDGICTEFDDRTFTCQCSLGRQGRLCDEELNITVPEFYSDSYLVHSSLSSVVNVQSYLLITLVFKPTAANGLILFNGYSNMDFSDYVSLALINSCIVYKFNLGTGVAEIVSPMTLSLNQWHTITANRTGRVGFLQVNNEPLVTKSSPGVLTGLNVAGDTWLGGTNQFNIISQYAGTSTGLTGCISMLSINGVPIDLITGAERGRNVGECNTTSCSSFPCLNGATCIETGSSFTCRCPFGYKGVLCGASTLSCPSNPCNNDGTCIEGLTEGTFSCLCPLGFSGNTCNDTLEVSTPSFNQTSYQEYSLPSPITLHTTLSLSFHPTSSNGLIFYIGDASLSRDFLSLSLVSGKLELRYDLGSGPAIIKSSSIIPLNQWTSVTVSRVRRDGILVVDGSSFNGSSPGTTTILNAAGNLYVGGGAEGVAGYQVSPNAGADVGLTGCINTDTLRINSFSLGSVISSRGITQCRTDSCSSSPCQNGGSCVSNGLSYSCICALGFSGDQCQESISIIEPSFSGSSYIFYVISTNTSQSVQFYLEIYPNASTGLILYSAEDSGAYIALYLQNGHVVLQFKQVLNSPVVITSTSSITLGQWHSISVSISEGNGSLSIDNALPVTGNGNFSYSLWLNHLLHVGGHPNLSGLGLPINGGFMGCLRLLEVSPGFSESVDLIANATVGAGITQCTATTSCNVNPCLNGGKCIAVQVNGTTEERCECSLPYAAGAKCERRVSFNSTFFSDDGYLQFPPGTIPIDSITIHTEIRFSIVPSNVSGLFLYIGYANPSSGNYIMAGMNEGKLEFRFQLGSGVGLVETSQPLEVGQQYDIVLLRTDHKGRLLVTEGNSTVYSDGVSEGLSRHLNLSPYDFVMFVGGAPNVPFTSQQVYQTGYSGCLLSTIQFGYAMNAEPVPFETSLSGENVKPCS